MKLRLQGSIAIITPLVKNGQSLHQIYLDHVDELMCSEKTLYNYVDAQLFDAGTSTFQGR